MDIISKWLLHIQLVQNVSSNKLSECMLSVCAVNIWMSKGELSLSEQGAAYQMSELLPKAWINTSSSKPTLFDVNFTQGSQQTGRIPLGHSFPNIWERRQGEDFKLL